MVQAKGVVQATPNCLGGPYRGRVEYFNGFENKDLVEELLAIIVNFRDCGALLS